MNKKTKIFLSIGISFAALWVAFRGVDWAELKNILKQVSWPLIGISVVIYSSAYWFRTKRWQIILSAFTKISLVRLFPILTFGFLMNTVLPFRAGELARAFAIKFEKTLDLATALSSIAFERLFDILGVLTIFGVAIYFYPTDLIDFEKLVWPALFLLLGVLLLFLLSNLLHKKLPFPLPFKEKIVRLIEQAKRGFGTLKSPRKIFWLFILSLVIYVIEVANVKNIGSALGFTLSLPEATFLFVGLGVGVVIPAAPGAIGTFELFGKQILIRMGYDANKALAFILFLHFFYILMILVMGSTYPLRMLSRKSRVEGDRET